MNKLIKIICIVLTTMLIFVIAGCSKQEPVEQAETENNASTPAATEETTTPSATEKSDQSTSSGDTEDASKLLKTIKSDAEKGKVINCQFATEGTIDDVETEWGKPDSDTFVSDAKGSYAEFNSKNVVFGYNKGDQIFEVRHVAQDQLSKVTLKDIENEYGKPQYTAKDTEGRPIIGYQVSDKHKLLFVMEKAGDDAGIDHYNVLWPKGSSDLMAGDMGKSW